MRILDGSIDSERSAPTDMSESRDAGFSLGRRTVLRRMATHTEPGAQLTPPGVIRILGILRRAEVNGAEKRVGGS